MSTQKKDKFLIQVTANKKTLVSNWSSAHVASIPWIRIYKMRPLMAFFVVLPGILACLWYAWQAYAAFDTYKRASGSDVQFNMELFHINLYDRLTRDMRRMTMPPAPSRSKSKLLSMALHMKQKDLGTVYEGCQNIKDRKYVPVKIEFDSSVTDGFVRLRGKKHWHCSGGQKSLKIKTQKGQLVNGYRIFNLINDPAPMVIGEQLILDIADKMNLLTPESSFARLHINEKDFGVFRYETHSDESLLRVNKRVPGSIYSDNLPPEEDELKLWSNEKYWNKPAWRTDLVKEDRRDIKELLNKLTKESFDGFVKFARNKIDIKAFARFEALDIAFGGTQHGFASEHRLYFDPYKGKWEPVAWNFRGYKHAPLFNTVENPLIIRLKTIPEYTSLRNEILYKLLNSKASVSKVIKRGRKMLKKLLPELASDKFFDAYKLLPKASSFFRQMLRPMNLEKAALVFESELATYSKRHDYLLNELKSGSLFIKYDIKNATELTMNDILTTNTTIEKTDDNNQLYNTPITLILDGRSGVSIKSCDVKMPADCKNPDYQIEYQNKIITSLPLSGRAELVLPFNLYPSHKLVNSDGTSSDTVTKNLITKTLPAAYEFELVSTCIPYKIEFEGSCLSTLFTMRSQTADDEILKKLPPKTPAVSQKLFFKPGEIFPHPRELALPPLKTIKLGPGIVKINKNTAFESYENVEIAAGTIFKMGRDASLIFMGKVNFNGTYKNPVYISGDTESWGGIVISGPHTKGSSLKYVVAKGGKSPVYGNIPYPAMINVHNTSQINISNCTFSDNRGKGDLVHFVYVKKLELESVAFINAENDAVDLEFSSSILKDITIYNASDDCVDLMGGKVQIINSLLSGCKGNAVSAGEESLVSIFDSFIEKSKVGILAKNSSQVEIISSLLYRNEVGLRVYKQTMRYEGDSRIESNKIFIVGSNKLIKTDKESKKSVDIGMILRRLPESSMLTHLKVGVLEISKWNEIETATKNKIEGLLK